jgi:hypothetical protein
MSDQSPLLPKDLRATLPPLYSTEDVADPMVRAKFFSPTSGWTWFVTEFDGEDTFFGLVEGWDVELGYFSLAELESVRGANGLPIERDLHFKPQLLSQVRAEVASRRDLGPGSEPL